MMATSVVQPLDLIKTRMQVASSAGGATVNLTGTVTSIIKKEGVLAVYDGLSAALFRQATYTTSRLGIYNVLEDLAK